MYHSIANDGSRTCNGNNNSVATLPLPPPPQLRSAAPGLAEMTSRALSARRSRQLSFKRGSGVVRGHCRTRSEGESASISRAEPPTSLSSPPPLASSVRPSVRLTTHGAAVSG